MTTVTDVERFLSAAYVRMLNRPCEATFFVVRKDSAYGFYLVHLLGTGYFYEAKWKVQNNP